MSFAREFQRLLILFLVGLLLILVASVYWGVALSSGLSRRDDNPRVFEARAAIIRGAIYDSAGRLLAESAPVREGSPRQTRRYLQPTTYSVLGYHSLQFGVGGIESAYDALLGSTLQADDLSAYVQHEILRQPYVGDDIQLTLDLDVQQRLADLLNGYRGAAVVLDAATGDVIAAVSLPTIDPNQLDTLWDALISDPRDPLYNRAFQAGYQPGGALQTMLMTAALISNQPIDTVIEESDEAVTVNDVTLTCAEIPPASRLTLGEAYAYACPAPFMQLYDAIGTERFQELYNLFRLDSPPVMSGFPLMPADATNNTFTYEDALGQGETTVTVAQMAAIAAAIVNGGNAPQPNLLHAVRSPDSTEWQVVREVRESIPITTDEVSRRVQTLMRESTVFGSARRAARSEIAIGGHASLARAGEVTLSWFMGFALTGTQDGIAIALVLEDTDDPTLAAEIGGQVLEIAYQRSIGLDTAND